MTFQKALDEIKEAKKQCEINMNSVTGSREKRDWRIKVETLDTVIKMLDKVEYEELFEGTEDESTV